MGGGDGYCGLDKPYGSNNMKIDKEGFLDV